jgi:hypothetical protein
LNLLVIGGDHITIFFVDPFDTYWLLSFWFRNQFSYVIFLNWYNLLIHNNSLPFILYSLFKHYRITCSKVTIYIVLHHHQ